MTGLPGLYHGTALPLAVDAVAGVGAITGAPKSCRRFIPRLPFFLLLPRCSSHHRHFLALPLFHFDILQPSSTPRPLATYVHRHTFHRQLHYQALPASPSTTVHYCTCPTCNLPSHTPGTLFAPHTHTHIPRPLTPTSSYAFPPLSSSFACPEHRNRPRGRNPVPACA